MEQSEDLGCAQLEVQALREEHEVELDHIRKES